MAAKQRPRAGFAGSNMCGGRDCARRADIVEAYSRGQFRAWLLTNYEKRGKRERERERVKLVDWQIPCRKADRRRVNIELSSTL